MGLKELQWTPVQTEIIELDGKKLLFAEVVSKIRKGEDALSIDHAALDGMNGEELAAYLTNLRRKYKQRIEDVSLDISRFTGSRFAGPDDAKTVDERTLAQSLSDEWLKKAIAKSIASIKSLELSRFCGTSLSSAELEEWDERAAIMEYSGCMPREEAERLALECVLKRREELKKEAGA